MAGVTLIGICSLKSPYDTIQDVWEQRSESSLWYCTSISFLGIGSSVPSLWIRYSEMLSLMLSNATRGLFISALKDTGMTSMQFTDMGDEVSGK